MHTQRFEWKYLVTPTEADHLIGALLARGMRWDKVVASSPSHHYPVTSLYFDSPAFLCYHDKRHGLYRRFKVRLRGYTKTLGQNAPLYLELKRKDGDIVTKDRITLARGAMEMVAARNIPGLTAPARRVGEAEERKVALRLTTLLANFALRPRIMVRYDRQPLIGTEANHLRVTFDRALEAYPYALGETYATALPPRRSVVMEIKYNGAMPVWLHTLIVHEGLQRIAFSKYCIGVTTLRSRLLI
ncbi:MAG: polyphosphate polymerase domain-containing protein [bacterium]|nr:polyphosphate polymerase domain-containing protein [bacterium]MDZ4285000.1 polyphosphate polymerase domain-containing protein [Patescibacteria group bacterium]